MEKTFQIVLRATSFTWERYVDVVPVESMLYCNVNALGTFAGEGVGDINNIPSVAELMDGLVNEYNDL